MFEVRIHGRGGQGVVTAAELLSIAAFDEGRHAQAFPSFGSERTGAPVVAFCRIDDGEIRLREPIAEPDALIVQDPTLLHQVDVFGGLGARRLHPDQQREAASTSWGSASSRSASQPERVLTVAGDRDRARAPRPADAERGAARRVRGADAAWSRSNPSPPRSARRFPGQAGEGNVAAAEEAYSRVVAQCTEPAHA